MCFRHCHPHFVAALTFWAPSPPSSLHVPLSHSTALGIWYSWHDAAAPATINNAYFKFSQVMPLEFPINTFRTTTTITRNTLFFNSPYTTTTAPPSARLCPSHTRSFILLCALLCFVVSDLVHKKIRNSIYKHVIEKVNTYTHTHTHTDTHICNKVKHVGICFYRSMANFVWSLCVPQSCLCVCVCVCVVYAKNATSYSNIKHTSHAHKHTNTRTDLRYKQTFQKTLTKTTQQQQQQNFP